MNEKYADFMENRSFEDKKEEERKRYNRLAPGNIEQCVNQALEEGDHLSFAKFFLKECASANELYRQKLEEYLSSAIYNAGKGLKLYDWRVFRDWDVEIGEAKDPFYSNARIQKYLQGTDASRDAILQLGICCRLSVRQLNKLLNMKGYPALYMLDILDILVAFQLKENKEDSHSGIIGVSDAQDMLDAFYLNSREVIREFHGKHEAEDSPLGFMEYRDSYRGKKKKDGAPQERKGEVKLKSRSPAYTIPLDEVVKNNLLQWENDDRHAAYVKEVTRFYNIKFQESKSVEEFLHTTFFPVFGYVRYSFPQMVCSYIENIEKYRKNLYFSGCRLTGDYEKKILEDYAKKNLIVKMGRSGMSMASKIFRYDNIILLPENAGIFNSSCSTTTLTQMYRGRVYGAEPIKEESAVDENGGGDAPDIKHAWYVFEMWEYRNLLRFAIATGNEDDLPYFMDSAGYEFLPYSDREHGVVEERTKAYLTYALAYRDALIDKWCSRRKELDSELLRERFPFIELLMRVSHDIEKAVWYQYPKVSNNVIKEEIAEILDSLVFPVWDIQTPIWEKA